MMTSAPKVMKRVTVTDNVNNPFKTSNPLCNPQIGLILQGSNTCTFFLKRNIIEEQHYSPEGNILNLKMDGRELLMFEGSCMLTESRWFLRLYYQMVILLQPSSHSNLGNFQK